VPNDIYQLVAKNINIYRIKHGLSQEDLAHSAGLNRAYIGYIERCERKPTLETINKIAKALRIEINKLFISQENY